MDAGHILQTSHLPNPSRNQVAPALINPVADAVPHVLQAQRDLLVRLRKDTRLYDAQTHTQVLLQPHIKLCTTAFYQHSYIGGEYDVLIGLDLDLVSGHWKDLDPDQARHVLYTYAGPVYHRADDSAQWRRVLTHEQLDWTRQGLAWG